MQNAGVCPESLGHIFYPDVLKTLGWRKRRNRPQASLGPADHETRLMKPSLWSWSSIPVGGERWVWGLQEAEVLGPSSV